MKTMGYAKRAWRIAIGFSALLPAVATADTLATSFETEPSGTFTIGTSPLTATFSGGNAMRVGVGQYYRTGTHSWHVAPGVTATITFETPAEQAGIWFRDTIAAGPSQVRIIDEQGVVLAMANGTQSFQQVAVTRSQGQTLIDRIEVQNMGNANDVVADDFSAVVNRITLSQEYKSVMSLADINGDNSTDFAVLRFNPSTNKNELTVWNGADGNLIRTVNYSSAMVEGSSIVEDANGDTIPEVGVLLRGSLFATVKEVVNGTQLGKPTFNNGYEPVAFLSIGDAGGGAGAGPDVAVVGLLPNTGKVQAQVKDVASGNLVKRMNFNRNYGPIAAAVLDSIGGSKAKDIAVLGINANGKVRAQIKDARSGTLINNVGFSKSYAPRFFAATPDASGSLSNLTVLGINGSGVIRAQTKSASDGSPISTVRFNKSYAPVAFFSFTDSNGSGGGEIGVVGVRSDGKVRAEIREIADGTLVKTITFNQNFPPLDAIAVNGVAGTGRNEIAVIGQNMNGDQRMQIKDLLSGNQVVNIPLSNWNEDDDPGPRPPPGY